MVKLIKKILAKIKVLLWEGGTIIGMYIINGDKNKVVVSPDNQFLECKIRFCGTNTTVKFGSKVIARNMKIEIFGNNNYIEFGDRCCLTDVMIRNFDDNNVLKIGKNFSCDETRISQEEGKTIIIGDDCLFSYGIDIRCSDGHSIIDETGKRINPAKDVVIGNHVWIGHHVYILKGANVGENCIIGAGSIVHGGNYESGSVLAGRPATVKKSNMNWREDRI